MKIGKRLIIMTIILNLTGIGALTGILLNLAQKQISGLIHNEITNLANESAKDIQIWLELYLDAVRTVGQGSRQILEAVGRLNEITGGVKGSSDGAEQINGAVNRVNEISGRNKSDIDELIREVNRFRIE
jgi:methyl-accepting chemotaxis protein